MALVVGLGGVTCGGKTTLARLLQQELPATVRVLHQDDYYWPPKVEASQHDDADDWDAIDAIDIERLAADVLQTIGQRSQAAAADNQMASSSHSNNLWPGRLSSAAKPPATSEGRAAVVIVEGHMLYYSSKLDALCDKRYFMTLPYELCKERRLHRTYDIPDPDGYFDRVCWPRYIESLRDAAARPDITLLDGSQPTKILKDRLLAEILPLRHATVRREYNH